MAAADELEAAPNPPTPPPPFKYAVLPVDIGPEKLLEDDDGDVFIEARNRISDPLAYVLWLLFTLAIPGLLLPYEESEPTE